jgi:predicted cupin superfamily sugar epimerase
LTEIQKIIKKFNLSPLPIEGGYYSQTYRSPLIIKQKNLSELYNGNRRLCSAIYYLLNTDTYSAIHKLHSDEIYHFYAGDPVELLQLYPDGAGEIVTIGNNIEENMMPQIVVNSGTWQGARMKEGGKFALMGTTVSPGFEFDDYCHGNRDVLISEYPKFAEMITELTRQA